MAEAPRLWPGQFLQQRPHPQLTLEKAGNKAYMVRCGQTPLLAILLLAAYFMVDRFIACECTRAVVGRRVWSGYTPTNLYILHTNEPYLHLAWVVSFGFLQACVHIEDMTWIMNWSPLYITNCMRLSSDLNMRCAEEG